jgi:D-sedoheptulose 7-phosphate isomerase
MARSEHERLAAARIAEAVEATQRLLEPETLAQLGHVGEALVAGFRSGGKLLVFGNGGSAAQSQHIAAELLGRLRVDRPPLPAIALVDGVAALTAIANDYSYADVFARQVDGLGGRGDVALALSTSGASENVVRAVGVARRRGLTTIAMTGPDRSPLGDAVDHCLRLPGAEVTRIQECHLVAAHILCEIVERALPDGVAPGA